MLRVTRATAVARDEVRAQGSHSEEQIVDMETNADNDALIDEEIDNAEAIFILEVLVQHLEEMKKKKKKKIIILIPIQLGHAKVISMVLLLVVMVVEPKRKSYQPWRSS